MSRGPRRERLVEPLPYMRPVVVSEFQSYSVGTTGGATQHEQHPLAACPDIVLNAHLGNAVIHGVGQPVDQRCLCGRHRDT